MYFKVSIRTNPATGDPDGYYRLVESYRNADDRVCHRSLLNVGFMGKVAPEELNRIQKLLNHKCKFPDNELFTVDHDQESPLVRKWFDELYGRLVSEKKIDVAELSPAQKKQPSDGDWETIDLNTVRHKEVREIGAEWLCYQALNQLGLETFLSSQADWSGDDARLAITHIISRAVYPASELKTSRWIKENSAVCDLTGFDMEKITKDQLYSISNRLYGIKDAIERHLSHRTNDIFDIEDTIVIFDLTNTYFEGEKRSSTLARHGRSKEKRSDAKLIVLALVINQFGFFKYSAILAGNASDPSALPSMVKELRSKTSTTAGKALVVIDAGIATKENLEKIRSEGYDYICVTRSRLKDYEIEPGSDPVTVTDKRGRKIGLQKVTSEKASAGGDEYYLKVESQFKQKKELSMNQRFRDGYLNGLAVIAGALSKKRGTKLEDKVRERVGRLKQKYPSIHRYYQIDYQIVETPATKKKPARRIVASISWKLKEDLDMDARCGVYFLGTSLKDENRILWDSYNIIREIESTIRVLKTDLDLRPVFHQKDESTMAHLHLALLAYWVVNTIRYQLKKEGSGDHEKGINLQWNEIVRIMNTHKTVITTAQNNCDQIIQITRTSEPNEKVKQIYNKLKYASVPFKKRKVVVHKSELRKNENNCFRTFQRE
jgi:transposase